MKFKMNFKPLDVKFTNERLNREFKIPKAQLPFCERHTKIDDLVYQNGKIFCKKCGTKLIIMPSWFVNV